MPRMWQCPEGHNELPIQQERKSGCTQCRNILILAHNGPGDGSRKVTAVATGDCAVSHAVSPSLTTEMPAWGYSGGVNFFFF